MYQIFLGLGTDSELILFPGDPKYHCGHSVRVRVIGFYDVIAQVCLRVGLVGH